MSISRSHRYVFGVPNDDNTKTTKYQPNYKIIITMMALFQPLIGKKRTNHNKKNFKKIQEIAHQSIWVGLFFCGENVSHFVFCYLFSFFFFTGFFFFF